MASNEDAKDPRPFLDFVRRRLLPIFPALIEHKELRGLNRIAGSSRKSLLDLILIDLVGSLSKTGIDEVFGLDPDYELLLQYLKCAAALTELGHPDYTVDARVFQKSGLDDEPAITTLITDIASENDYFELLELGKLFGSLIADCEAANDPIVNREDYCWTGEQPFSIDDYVSSQELLKLASSDLVVQSGVTHELLKQAASMIQLQHEGNLDMLKQLLPTSPDR